MKLTVNFTDGLIVEMDYQDISLGCVLCGHVEHGDPFEVERRHKEHIKTHGPDALCGSHSTVTASPRAHGEIKVSHRC